MNYKNCGDFLIGLKKALPTLLFVSVIRYFTFGVKEKRRSLTRCLSSVCNEKIISKTSLLIINIPQMGASGMPSLLANDIMISKAVKGAISSTFVLFSFFIRYFDTNLCSYLWS